MKVPLRKNTPVHGLHIIPWWQPVNFPAPPVERGHEQSGQKPPRDTYNNGLSVVDATKYSITREFNMPVYPNQMVLSDDMDTLYIGIKEGFNRDWDPDVFVEGAKERILSIDLKKS